MKKLSRILPAVLLALALCVSTLPVLAETAEDTDTLIYFEEMGVYVKMPAEIMFVTRESPESDPMFSLLAGAGVSYDEFKQYMTENQMYLYGLMLTDYSSEFSLVIDTLATSVNLNGVADAVMQVYLGQAKKVLEDLGAHVMDSGIYRGELYDGLWFHYVLDFGDAVQHVIQYSIISGTRTVNLRVYGFDGGFNPENEEIIKKVYDTVLVLPPEDET